MTGYFHVLAFVKNAAMNMRVEISFQVGVLVSSGRSPSLITITIGEESTKGALKVFFLSPLCNSSPTYS